MKVLLLAGTLEARQLAEALAGLPDVDTIASFAGATRAPRPMAVTTRVGGFGGTSGFRRYLGRAGIEAVLIATHPFAARMTANAARVSAEMSVPCLRLLRPPWQQSGGERWFRAKTEADVAALVPASARVFLATGPARLAEFSGLETHEVFCRRVDKPRDDFPFAKGRFIVARPPFSVDQEKALFMSLKIDWLVARNSGGAAGRAKLDAAQALGLDVALIERPQVMLNCPGAARVQEAVDWVKNLSEVT